MQPGGRQGQSLWHSQIITRFGSFAPRTAWMGAARFSANESETFGQPLRLAGRRFDVEDRAHCPRLIKLALTVMHQTGGRNDLQGENVVCARFLEMTPLDFGPAYWQDRMPFTNLPSQPSEPLMPVLSSKEGWPGPVDVTTPRLSTLLRVFPLAP